jgi:lipopolysaccharide transport system permease protein
MTTSVASLSVPRMPRWLVYQRDLLWELVVRDLKLRYKRSYLGIAWTLVNPLAQLAVYTFVFTVLFNNPAKHFMVFLFIGITSWTWTQSAILEGTTAILRNRDLIRQPGFPSRLLPQVTVGTHLLHFLLTFPITFAMIYFSWDLRVHPSVLWLPLIILVQYAFTAAFSVLAACIHVNFRDTQYLLSVFLMLAFFLTPIIYEIDMVPARYRWAYHLNPMTYIIDAYRAVLIRGQMPDLESLGVVTLLSLVLLRVAYVFFRRTSATFVEES